MTNDHGNIGDQKDINTFKIWETSKNKIYLPHPWTILPGFFFFTPFSVATSCKILKKKTFKNVLGNNSYYWHLKTLLGQEN